jgi:hypothetical protein
MADLNNPTHRTNLSHSLSIVNCPLSIAVKFAGRGLHVLSFRDFNYAERPIFAQRSGCLDAKRQAARGAQGTNLDGEI